jgi:hypothetical protein
MRSLGKCMAGAIALFSFSIMHSQHQYNSSVSDTLPSDLPLPAIRVLKNTGDGYIFAAVPYWGKGSAYLVAYSNNGRPVMYKKVSSACTDFKMQENGRLTYYDFDEKKFIVLDSTLSAVDSFTAQNGFSTDEHDLKILQNGHALLIGYAYKEVDMSSIVQGGSRNARVIVNVLQEIDGMKNVVFEWKADEHYRYTDVGPEVNLLDESFEFTHINSIDVDRDGGLIISSRHLDEVTKIDRKTGAIIWRFGGKNNQFRFTNDTIGFSGQHSACILPNGNLLLFDNGVYHDTRFSRVLEYALDEVNKTADLVWSYRNTPDISSTFWGNAQRLENGNTFIGWGYAGIAATEVDPSGNTVFEMTFPKDVYSYRIYRFAMRRSGAVSSAGTGRIVSRFTLDQNYPNPFNPSTTISFTLPVPSFVSLKIFDVLGREAAAIVSEELSAGNHSRQWNASGLSGGMYFCRLQAGSFSETKRLVVLR